MINLKRIFNIILMLIGFVVLVCFIGAKLGYKELLLVGTANIPNWLFGLLCILISDIHIAFIGSIVLSEYSFKIIKYMIPYYVINFILLIIMPVNIIISMLIPYCYILIIAIIKKSFKKSLFNFIIFVSTYSIYQLAVLIYRIGSIYFGFNNIPQYQWFITIIDTTIIILILFYIGGIKNYDRISGMAVRKWCWDEHRIFPEQIIETKSNNEEDLALERFNKLRGFKRVKAILLLLGFQIVQWAIILIACAIGNVLAEGFIITISFLTLGIVIRRRWHSNSILICTLLSVIMFYTAARFSPSLYYSQIIPILIGLVLVYTMYRIVLYTDKYNDMQNKFDDQNKFKLEYYCDYDKLKDAAEEKNLTPKEIELLNWRYCKKSSWIQMENHFYWSNCTIRKYIKLAEQKLYN